MKGVFFFKFFGKLFLILAWLFIFSKSSAEAANSPDAIAFRVMPNVNGQSPLRWYQDNIKVKGSPQALTVDGYQAVRDGRTVYVNAANIAKNSAEVDTLYTNIYIISYNQQAENQTVDIFGQILEHWQFNSNITVADEKIQIIRDVKRLADLYDVKLALKKYQDAHSGSAPALPAGSYLIGKSISVWPSWQATLGAALGITMPIDPLNELGVCDGFDKITCWNQNSKTFDDPSPPPGNSEFNLPVGSRAYVYEVKPNSYNLCAYMESPYIGTAQGNCPGALGLIQKPTINCGLTTVEHDQPFIGFVSLTGPDAARFSTWEIAAFQPATWDLWFTDGWKWNAVSPPGGLKINNTTTGTIKKITALKAPPASGDPASGNYKYKVKVSYGAITEEKICDIKVICLPDCPLANTICIGQTYSGPNAPDGCCGECNVAGTKCCDDDDADWTPDLGQYCSNETITQTSKCGATREKPGAKTDGHCCTAITWDPELDTICSGVEFVQTSDCNTTRKAIGAKTDGGCCVSSCIATNQPGCYAQAAAPANAVVNSSGGSCCGGETCYKCADSYTWNNATKTCEDHCGNGVVEDGSNGTPNYGEDCDYDFTYPSTGQKGEDTCKGILTSPPTWCPANLLVSGIRTCTTGCQWGADCDLNPPEERTSTSCDFANAEITDSACCMLTGCSQDGCACCGKGAAVDSYGAVNVKQTMDVTWDSFMDTQTNYYWWCRDGTACGASYYQDPVYTPVFIAGEACVKDYLESWTHYTSSDTSCDSCEDKLYYLPTQKIGACKLNKNPNDPNGDTWIISTNHSSASYKCWK